jgi:hypothetical protein
MNLISFKRSPCLIRPLFLCPKGDLLIQVWLRILGIHIFVIYFVFFWLLYSLFSFDWRLLFTTFISSNLSSNLWQINHIVSGRLSSVYYPQYRQCHMNLISFKRSPCLIRPLFLCPKGDLLIQVWLRILGIHIFQTLKEEDADYRIIKYEKCVARSWVVYVMLLIIVCHLFRFLLVIVFPVLLRLTASVYHFYIFKFVFQFVTNKPHSKSS